MHHAAYVRTATAPVHHGARCRMYCYLYMQYMYGTLDIAHTHRYMRFFLPLSSQSRMLTRMAAGTRPMAAPA